VTEQIGDGVMVFDAQGRLVYANEAARFATAVDLDPKGQRIDPLRTRLQELGAMTTPLWSRGDKLGELILIPRRQPSATLAEQERQAIFDALRQTGGHLANTARRLGVSRTTLWRRLRTYGVRPEAAGARARRRRSARDVSLQIE
jgi:transcriptional regulator of acetoin/glycerol metabolism